MPYLCIDRHNHKYYKPITPYCKGVRGNWGNFFLIGAGTLLREISLLSNPSKTPALGKASVSKAEPSTAAFETRRRNIHWIFL